MKRILILLFGLIALSASAQNDEKDEVMATVNNVFEAMRTNDSTLLRSCFIPDARAYTLIPSSDPFPMREGSIDKFIEAVGKPKSDVWNEPIWNEKVHIDGVLATVWVDYAFYLNDKLLHCGVDAFQLVKTGDGWKIFVLADTRRMSDCEIPEEVRKKF